VLGGYWMIRVNPREEAIEWASRCPASGNEVIEVRQVQEMGDFPHDVQEAAAGFAHWPSHQIHRIDRNAPDQAHSQGAVQ
jgi:hypothetical protein